MVLVFLLSCLFCFNTLVRFVEQGLNSPDLHAPSLPNAKNYLHSGTVCHRHQHKQKDEGGTRAMSRLQQHTT